MIELVIKLNENPIPNDCPLCRKETNPNIGAEIFLAGTNQVVCFDCASRRSPVLASLIAFSDLSRMYQQAEENFGEKWQNNQNIKGSPMNTFQSFGVQKMEVEKKDYVV